ncbi:hypothetical protein A9Q99_18890 [Gammaproteobacteria bacterium 45_16_T64]|nr:hypothetical protein A9Q99_18890 [Gammaproteobacteria bacterium 45_16_T64]
MKSIIKKLIAPIAMGAALLSATPANAALEKRTFCVFDIIGKQGDVYSLMEDYRLEAMKWGVDFTLKAYTDEKIAAEDLKSGKCDAAGITGIRGRSFNSFTGTLDSLGSIPTYDHMKQTLKLLMSPKFSKYMTSGDYEVAGISPGGAGYLFTNDKSVNNVAKMSGKKVAVLDFDKSQAIMVSSIGASPVSATIATFGPMFNNGSVDIIAAPAIAYEPLELYKGLGENGAIADFAILQLSLQMLIRHDRFPEGFGQKSRAYSWSQYDRAIDLINVSTDKIKPQYWMSIPEEDKVGYSEMFRQTRLKLRDMGIYNGKMLKFLARVRCKLDAGLAECSAADKE